MVLSKKNDIRPNKTCHLSPKSSLPEKENKENRTIHVHILEKVTAVCILPELADKNYSLSEASSLSSTRSSVVSIQLPHVRQQFKRLSTPPISNVSRAMRPASSRPVGRSAPISDDDFFVANRRVEFLLRLKPYAAYSARESSLTGWQRRHSAAEPTSDREKPHWYNSPAVAASLQPWQPEFSRPFWLQRQWWPCFRILFPGSCWLTTIREWYFPREYDMYTLFRRKIPTWKKEKSNETRLLLNSNCCNYVVHYSKTP